MCRPASGVILSEDPLSAPVDKGSHSRRFSLEPVSPPERALVGGDRYGARGFVVTLSPFPSSLRAKRVRRLSDSQREDSADTSLCSAPCSCWSTSAVGRKSHRRAGLPSELLTWYARKVSAFCFRIAGLQPRSAFEAGFPETSCWSGSAPRKGIRRLATDGQNSAGLA